MDQQQLVNLFAFHPANDQRRTLHEKIRQDFRTLAISLNSDLADSREKSSAITHLQTAMMFANAAVALHHGEEDATPAGEEDPTKAKSGDKPAENDYRTVVSGKNVNDAKDSKDSKDTGNDGKDGGNDYLSASEGKHVNDADDKRVETGREKTATDKAVRGRHVRD